MYKQAQSRIPLQHNSHTLQELFFKLGKVSPLIRASDMNITTYMLLISCWPIDLTVRLRKIRLLSKWCYDLLFPVINVCSARPSVIEVIVLLKRVFSYATSYYH